MNAFEILRLENRLTLDPGTLRDAFREAGKSAHPDAGGDEDSFAALREAHTTLASPSRRLRHWLELRGFAVESRGTVAPRVMDLFTPVGEVIQRAEAQVRRREEAKTPLGRAMLENGTQSCREEVERAIAIVDEAIATECAVFGDYESGAAIDPGAASTTVRNLAFLEKWLGTLRALFARLV